MNYEWIEVNVKLVGKDWRESTEVYSQRIRYEYFQQSRPGMVAEIASVVNELPMPHYRIEPPMSPEEIEMAFDKQYALHKSQS